MVSTKEKTKGETGKGGPGTPEHVTKTAWLEWPVAGDNSGRQTSWQRSGVGHENVHGTFTPGTAGLLWLKQSQRESRKKDRESMKRGGGQCSDVSHHWKHCDCACKGRSLQGSGKSNVR